MPKRVTFALQKGGVGKSSSTVSVAAILAATGNRVLVVDFDPQGNTTRMLTGNSIYQYSGSSIMEAIEERDAGPYIVEINESLHLIPAEDRLATFSRHIYTSRINQPFAVLKRLLEPIENRYDYVFIDIGPTLGDTVVNAIVYADSVIIPVDLGDLATEGMIRFIEFLEQTAEEGHTRATVDGILLTMRDGRVKNEREISEGIRAMYGDLVFRTEINRRARIKEIASKGVDLKDAAMLDYINFTEELIERLHRKEEGQ